MANALYPKFKQKLMEGTIDMTANTIKIALIDTGVYTYNAADEFWSSAVAGVIGTPQTLAGKSVTSGVFNASAVTYSAVAGASVEALIIYKDTGVNGTSPLIAYIDTGQTGLPVTPSGVDITYTPTTSIFTL